MSEHKAWRDVAGPIVEAVLRDTEGQSEESVQRALHEAYPWAAYKVGVRMSARHQVWLDVVRRQRGKRKPAAADPRQLRMWG